MSVCLSVCVSVCPFVCSLLRQRLNVFLPPLPEVGCPIFLEIRNPWGKSSGKKWSQIWKFLFENGLKSPRQKKFFFCLFCLTKHGGNHASRWIRDLWSKGVSLILAYLLMFFSFCFLDDFFCFSKKSGFGVFLVHPPMASVLLSASVARCFVSLMRDFFFVFFLHFLAFFDQEVI